MRVMSASTETFFEHEGTIVTSLPMIKSKARQDELRRESDLLMALGKC